MARQSCVRIRARGAPLHAHVHTRITRVHCVQPPLDLPSWLLTAANPTSHPHPHPHPNAGPWRLHRTCTSGCLPGCSSTSTSSSGRGPSPQVKSSQIKGPSSQPPRRVRTTSDALSHSSMLPVWPGRTRTRTRQCRQVHCRRRCAGWMRVTLTLDLTLHPHPRPHPHPSPSPSILTLLTSHLSPLTSHPHPHPSPITYHLSPLTLTLTLTRRAGWMHCSAACSSMGSLHGLSDPLSLVSSRLTKPARFCSGAPKAGVTKRPCVPRLAQLARRSADACRMPTPPPTAPMPPTEPPLSTPTAPTPLRPQVKSGQVKSGQVKSGQVKSGQVKPAPRAPTPRRPLLDASTSPRHHLPAGHPLPPHLLILPRHPHHHPLGAPRVTWPPTTALQMVQSLALRAARGCAATRATEQSSCSVSDARTHINTHTHTHMTSDLLTFRPSDLPTF